jgi:hypothetical protein
MKKAKKKIYCAQETKDSFLKQDTAVRNSDFTKWILSEGTASQPKSWRDGPLELRRMVSSFLEQYHPQVGFCYANAAALTLAFPEINYCTGYFKPLCGHAWSEYQGYVFDITIEENWCQLPCVTLDAFEWLHVATLTYDQLTLYKELGMTETCLIESYHSLAIKQNPLIWNGAVYRLVR